MKKILMTLAFAAMVTALSAQQKTVKVIWMIPTDVEYRESTRKAMEDGIRAVQSFFAEQTGGYTFTLHDPVVEVYRCEKESRWYTETKPERGEEDSYWWCLENAIEEATRKLGFSRQDQDHKWVIYISAKGNGGASGIVTVLPLHDVEGVAGISDDRAGKGILRWWGGLAHELGHCFAMPDIYRENSMSIMGDAGFYAFPNNINSQYEQDILLNSTRNAGFMHRAALKPAAEPVYVIRNRANGRVLEWAQTPARNEERTSADGKTVRVVRVPAGREVRQAAANGSDAQKWKLTRMDGGFFRISPASDTGMGLLYPGRLAGDDQFVVKYSNYYDMTPHKWIVFPYEDDYLICSPDALRVLSFDDMGRAVLVTGSTAPENIFSLEAIE